MAIGKEDFTQAAKETWAKLRPAFEAEPMNFFWRLGHSFDTIIDYFVTTDDTDAKAFAATALEKANGEGWWDDFGWWGIAALRAAACGKFDSKDVESFRALARNCWKQMNDNAPYGWDRATPDFRKAHAGYAPLYPRGVWNAVMNDNCYGGTTVDEDCGRQNTVTNGLYWSLSERLARVERDPIYSLTANNAFLFLSTWFKGPGAERLALMHRYDVVDPNDRAGKLAAAFVRERVGAFQGKDAEDPAYRDDLAWAGDQGLILGGLLARMLFKTSEYPVLLGTARQMLVGARNKLSDTQTDKRGILRPWWPGDPPGHDPENYWTGPAVYMRYLVAAFQNNDLKKDLQQSGYQDFIRANAEYVVKNPDRPQADDKVVSLTNNLACLVAAIAMLPP